MMAPLAPGTPPCGMETGFSTNLIVLGAGAAGLFAACRAAEAGLSLLLMERRHRPGLKLLMCGNNRCNFGHDGTPEQLLRAYGEPVAPFLRQAMRAFPSTEMAHFLERRGLPVKRLGERFYPASERGDDLLHLFTDLLRETQTPVLYQCPAEHIVPLPEGGFRVEGPKLSLSCRHLLLALGGCSYPQTGSLGDGFLFAQELGLRATPPRPGLAALRLPPQNPLAQLREEVELPWVEARTDNLPPTGGNLLLQQGTLRGSAVYDMTRKLARNHLPLQNPSLDLLPQLSQEDLARKGEALQRRHGQNKALVLNGLGLPRPLAEILARKGGFPLSLLKEFPLQGAQTRPLKEAIVTVGGLALEEFDPATMECRKYPGLYAAGECLDLDGPTGGYNLAAAFATANLAVHHILEREGGRGIPPRNSLPQRGKTERDRRGLRNEKKTL